jgi:hypothetical protein
MNMVDYKDWCDARFQFKCLTQADFMEIKARYVRQEEMVISCANRGVSLYGADFPNPTAFNLTALPAVYTANDIIYSVPFILYHLYIFNNGYRPAMSRKMHRLLGMRDVVDKKVINFEDYCRFLISPFGNTTGIYTVVSK